MAFTRGNDMDLEERSLAYFLAPLHAAQYDLVLDVLQETVASKSVFVVDRVR
jgi:hypothetical protein